VIAERAFRNRRESVTEARHYVLGELSDVGRDTTDVVALLVSELATNCIRHAGSEFTVRLERDTDGLTVFVTDRGGGSPVVRSPGPREPSGRGLRIVESMADGWGVDAESGGKTVWFRLSL
jgi:anti-sigma regulatory factor (Ser/Thr protein kinase)